MRPEPTPAQVRALLVQLADERGSSLAALSRLIGKNPAYLHQFVTRGSPKRLHEDDRRNLAAFLDIDERELGARERYIPTSDRKSGHRT